MAPPDFLESRSDQNWKDYNMLATKSARHYHEPKKQLKSLFRTGLHAPLEARSSSFTPQ